MRHRRRNGLPPLAAWLRALRMVLPIMLLMPLLTPASMAAAAETTSLEELVGSVVRIKTQINPDGETVRGLGRERDGSGIVIDNDGLVLTIGYLMVEAYAAEVITNDGRTVPANVVGYDHESGFGLLRVIEPLKLKPIPLGKSADVKEHDVAVVASFGGAHMVAPVYIVSKREFAGNWEYMLDEALFTSPPHPAWSGAALISHEGKLIGVGSLVLGDVTGANQKMPGNMFVPIDRLGPILADLLASGHVAGGGRPWLGINTDDMRGHLIVTRVTAGGPGDKAGLRRGDVIMSVNGDQPKNLADFYRKVWAQGGAGTAIPLDVLQDSTMRRVTVQSINRLDHLKLRSTF